MSNHDGDDGGTVPPEPLVPPPIIGDDDESAVNGTEPRPLSNQPVKRAIWDAKDKAAKITIRLAVSNSCIHLVKYAETAAEAWKELEKAYSAQTVLTGYHYRAQLVRYCIDDNKPIGTQLNELHQLRSKQIESGLPCDDWDFAITILIALPESYSVMRQSIIASHPDLKKLSVSSVIGLIMQEALNKKTYRATNVDSDVAFAARPGGRPPQPRQDKRKQNKDKTGTCNFCKREGHWESDCNKKKEYQLQAQQGADKSNQRRSEKLKAKSTKGDENAAPFDKRSWIAKLSKDDPSEEAKITHERPTAGEWWEFDSGASRVFHGDIAAFSDYKAFEKPIPIGLAADGASMNALGTGTLTIRFLPPNSPPIDFTITKAYHAPGIMNLISIAHLDDLGRRIQFHSKQIDIWDGDVLELSVPRNGNSYSCCGEIIFPEKGHATKISRVTWHRRCGHLGHTSILELAKKELVNDLELDVQSSGSTTECDACLRGKHTRSSFPTGGRTRATKPLELIHSDVCGPFPPSQEGYKYYVSLIDDYTEFGVVYCLKEKSGVFEAFKHYHARAEKHTDATLKAVQTDNGGEYKGDFERYCTSHGIHHRRTTPYTPEQNGVAERMNRTLNNAVVSCLLDANLGDAYWADAVLYAMYNRNRSPSRAIPGYVPFTLWNNNYKPSIAHLRPFGCTVYIHIPKKVRSGKLGPKSTKVMFIGYDSNRKAWRFYDPVSRKESSSRDATFLEDVLDMSTKEEVTFDSTNCNKEVQHFDDSDSDSDDEHIIPTPKPPSTSTSIPNPSPSPPNSTPNPIPAPSPSLPTPTDPPSLSRKDRTRKQTVKHTDNTWMPHHARMAREFGLATTDPRSYREALSSPDAKQWEDSIQAEYNSLVKMGTFEIVDLPPGRKAIPSTYVFKEKKGPNGETLKFKTRIVARGDMQKKGEDFDKVFAPVPRLDTVRAVFSYTASQGWEIDQLDFKSAFLNGDLKEEVYMKPPQGFQRDDGKVWKLKKSLYGLRQSPKCWHDKLTTSFTEFQLVRSTADFSVYVGCHGKDTTILVTHVDDMAITGSNTRKKNEVKEYIKENYDVEDMGKLKYYLGINWDYDLANRVIHASQKKFMLEILERFSMLESYPSDIPVIANHQFTIEDSPEKDSDDQRQMAKVPYLEAIGSLMYLMLGTRPDLAYAIGKLSRFGTNPGPKHWKAVKRVLRYVKGTLNYGITLGGSPASPILTGYSDASFQDCPDTSQSTSGYVFYFGDAPISWSSKRQGIVTNSTMEAEYLGLSNAARHTIWLRELMEDLGCPQTEPTMLFGDNNASLILAEDVSDHSRAKHVKRVYHYVRERIQQEKDITVKYCPGNQNIADIFTKPLGNELFFKFSSCLITPIPPGTDSTSGSVV
ncbi:hypothetical protein FRC01_008347 [Tulasnella sp. 417]|nr:hypothetical protein FRC01_008347 [Tulasnella sp. 417]